MSFNPTAPIAELNRILGVIRNLPTEVGVEAVQFFKEGFNKQGWQGDSGLDPWVQRRDPISGRNLLIGKGTANLKKGITKRVIGRSVIITVEGVAEKYADIHNFGGTIQVTNTPALKKWAWAMYYKEKEGGSATFASMYKAMALSKKPHFEVKIPKRQFIGESRQLQKRLNEYIQRRLMG